MTVPEITPDELLKSLERGENPQVLDVRAPERVRLGHIEAPDYRNLPGSVLSRYQDPRESGLDVSRPVAVVCDRGMSSRPVTAWLRGHGFEARSLAGGMLAYMNATVTREPAGLRGLDRLLQIDRVGKGSLGYLAIRQGEALAVDVGRDLSPWREALAASGARLTQVVDTHCHADYLSGGAALARAFGVRYRLHPADSIDPFDGTPGRVPFEALYDGEELPLGDARFVVEHLPGHTEGSVALRLGDELVLTGDLLFVGSVGRPDLADRTESWAGDLWKSLQRVREIWPAAIRIFPGHYSAESERDGDRMVSRRLVDLAAINPPFALSDAESFRAWIRERAGDYPEAYRHIKRANLGLIAVDGELASELEAGRNQCALTSSPQATATPPTVRVTPST